METLEISTPTDALSTISEEDIKEYEEKHKPTPEQIQARNEAFLKFWNEIQHLQNDPDFSRLPIPYNYNAILDMIYKQIDEDEGLKRLTGPEIEKYNEIKEEMKEKYDEPEEDEEKPDKKKKKRKNRKH